MTSCRIGREVTGGQLEVTGELIVAGMIRYSYLSETPPINDIIKLYIIYNSSFIERSTAAQAHLEGRERHVVLEKRDGCSLRIPGRG